MAHVLIAYASPHGSTSEVAQRIAGILGQHGITADLRQAATVRDLHRWDAVVLGAPLYVGRWHHDARAFLRRHRRQLEQVPLAVFALGPRTLEEHDVDSSREQLRRALAAAPELTPLSVAVFGGAIDPSRLRFPFSRMEAADARDWDAIRAWADELATTLDPQHLAVGAV